MSEAELFELAASGDRVAQLALLETALSMADVPAPEAIVAAEIIARFVAAHGHPNDELRLAGILIGRAHHLRAAGDLSRAKVLEADAVQRLGRLADEGFEPAAECLNTVADHVSPEVLALAREFEEC